MALGSTFKDDLVGLVFQAVAIANIADNAASAPLTNLYVSLHTANPVAGNQTTSESAYTGYDRVAVARSAVGFDKTTGTVTNAAAVTFPACTALTSQVTYFAIGTAASGAGKILVCGAITTPAAGLAVSVGVTPSFAIGALSAVAS